MTEMTYLINSLSELKLRSESFKEIISCNLKGAGFEGWDGILAASDEGLAISSKPGIFFSDGASFFIPWTLVHKYIVVKKKNKRNINFEIEGEQYFIVAENYENSEHKSRDFDNYIYKMRADVVNFKALKLFEEACELMDNNNYVDAISLFNKVNEIDNATSLAFDKIRTP